MIHTMFSVLESWSGLSVLANEKNSGDAESDSPMRQQATGTASRRVHRKEVGRTLGGVYWSLPRAAVTCRPCAKDKKWASSSHR
jgi:hypothetical protein